MNSFFRPSPVIRTRTGAYALITILLAITPTMFAVGAEKNQNRAERRIDDLHRMLTIQPGQEAQWAVVATIMRDNAVTMDALTQLRIDHIKDFSAVDDLSSYGDISAAHAEGIRKLTPAFRTLYETMSVTQRDQADFLFRRGEQTETSTKTATEQ